MKSREVEALGQLAIPLLGLAFAGPLVLGLLGVAPAIGYRVCVACLAAGFGALVLANASAGRARRVVGAVSMLVAIAAVGSIAFVA